MATAVVLTPQPITASVLIQITGAPAGPVVITRTDANGTGSVRLRTGQAPIAGAMTVTDYEPALVGAISYDVVDSALVTTTASTTLAGSVTSPQISGIQQPALSVVPELVTGYASSRETGSTDHDIVGRADPVVVLGPTKTRKGRLEVWCRTYADAAEASNVFALARVLLLRQPDYPGLDMYFLARSINVEPLAKTSEGWRWQTTAEYTEVRNPSLPLLGAAGWTFDDVIATYPTFAAVRAAFATFDDLLIGP